MDKKYIPILDSFRAVSILFVMISHAGFENKVPGGFGVTVFFFISGFLITKLLVQEFNKTGSVDLKQFYIRRLLRLYPALILMVFIAGAFVYFADGTFLKGDIMAALLYYTNYYLVYFRGGFAHAVQSIFIIQWSLAVEEHFYLFFPILFLLLNKKQAQVAVLLLLILLPLVVRVYNLETIPDYNRARYINYLCTHTRIDSIAFGCLCAILVYRLKWKPYLDFIKGNLPVFIGIALILFTFIYRDPYFRESYRYTIQGIALSLIVPSLVLFERDTAFMRKFQHPFILLIGRLSYSLYLFHWVAVCVASFYFKDYSPMWYLVFITGTILLTSISYNLVETPMKSIRKKFGSITT